jgi:fido (protein-threonine AMPylation protein)
MLYPVRTAARTVSHELAYQLKAHPFTEGSERQTNAFAVNAVHFLVRWISPVKDDVKFHKA